MNIYINNNLTHRLKTDYVRVCYTTSQPPHSLWHILTNRWCPEQFLDVDWQKLSILRAQNEQSGWPPSQLLHLSKFWSQTVPGSHDFTSGPAESHSMKLLPSVGCCQYCCPVEQLTDENSNNGSVSIPCWLRWRGSDNEQFAQVALHIFDSLYCNVLSQPELQKKSTFKIQKKQSGLLSEQSLPLDTEDVLCPMHPVTDNTRMKQETDVTVFIV